MTIRVIPPNSAMLSCWY